VVIDPFAGGGLVSQGKITAICRAYLGEEGDASALSVVRMSNRDVLARLLNNQAVRAETGNDPRRALEVYRRITQIAPEVLGVWQKLARLQLTFNDVAGARESLFAMSEVAPDRKTRDRIMDAFEELGLTRSASP
jgi:regulator of sirC expression with transglutaminase-like and TPR domain